MAFLTNALLVATSLVAVAPQASAQTYPVDIRVSQERVRATDDAAGIKALLAPGASEPKIGGNKSVIDYTRWARTSLGRGDLAEAARALEWAQLRRRVDEEELALSQGRPPAMYDADCDRILCRALKSVGMGNTRQARRELDKALAAYAAAGGSGTDFADPAMTENGVASGAADTDRRPVRRTSVELAMAGQGRRTGLR